MVSVYVRPAAYGVGKVVLSQGAFGKLRNWVNVEGWGVGGGVSGVYAEPSMCSERWLVSLPELFSTLVSADS